MVKVCLQLFDMSFHILDKVLTYSFYKWRYDISKNIYTSYNKKKKRNGSISEQAMAV